MRRQLRQHQPHDRDARRGLHRLILTNHRTLRMSTGLATSSGSADVVRAARAVPWASWNWARARMTTSAGTDCRGSDARVAPLPPTCDVSKRVRRAHREGILYATVGCVYRWASMTTSVPPYGGPS